MRSTDSQTIEQLMVEISKRERLARKSAVFYTLIPIVVAAVLVIWTGEYLLHAKAEAESVREQAELLNIQLRDSATKLVDIATVATQIESLVESKQSYLRTIDEARFLIDLRMKFDSLNAEIVKLSGTVPAMRSMNKDRKWVTVVKSSKNLATLKQLASKWIADYGRSDVAIYETPNGFYALC